jgi:hypothetical protein
MYQNFFITTPTRPMVFSGGQEVQSNLDQVDLVRTFRRVMCLKPK